jgi:hypothetical protein
MTITQVIDTLASVGYKTFNAPEGGQWYEAQSTFKRYDRERFDCGINDNKGQFEARCSAFHEHPQHASITLKAYREYKDISLMPEVYGWVPDSPEEILEKLPKIEAYIKDSLERANEFFTF